MSLENAPDDVKLAVDLIMLLESHDIAPDVVLSALEIVKRDFEKKLAPGGAALTGPANYAFSGRVRRSRRPARHSNYAL